MTVTVLLFASYAEALGVERLTLQLPERGTAADVLARVRALADGRALPPSPLLAVNERYASPEQPLKDGDEVALIPPVAGG